MVNVAVFERINVIDTCAVWNVLSSRLFYSAARQAGCQFACTRFVRYECIHKPRTSIRTADEELKLRLERAHSAGDFQQYELDIADLQEVEILQNRKRLSLGELSSIAFAKKIGRAFMTDDQKARKLGCLTLGNARVQTTPHLFGWLIFGGFLSDSDKVHVIQEHVGLDGILSRYLEETYLEALRCRLMAQGNVGD
jgi:hypothetical protein